MYLILSILLGLCLGSIFYAFVSKNESKSRAAPKFLISAALMGMSAAAMYFCIYTSEAFVSAMIIITLFILGFESINDIHCMSTRTVPIYLTCAIIIIINTAYKIENKCYWQLLTIYELTILFGICCYCLSILTNEKIGYGDFDIYFLIFLTEPVFAVILMASAIVVFVKDSLFTGRKALKTNYIISADGQLMLPRGFTKKVPFVPFLLVGYIMYVIIGGVL